METEELILWSLVIFSIAMIIVLIYAWNRRDLGLAKWECIETKSNYSYHCQCDIFIDKGDYHQLKQVVEYGFNEDIDAIAIAKLRCELSGCEFVYYPNLQTNCAKWSLVKYAEDMQIKND